MKRASILLALLASSASAAQVDLGGSQLGGRWLNLIETPRGAAFGQALGAVPERVEGRATDPSALALLSEASLSLSHHQWVEGINVQTLSGGTPLGHWAGLGLRVAQVSFGEVPLTQLAPGGGLIDAGTLQPKAYNASADLGLPLGGGWRVGAGLAWLGQDLGDGMRSAVLGNFGLGLSTQWGTNFSASLLNLGSQLDGAELPTRTALAASQALADWSAGRLRLSLGAGLPLRDTEPVKFSAALDLATKLGVDLWLGWHGQERAVNGLALGAGLPVGPVVLDYTWRLGSVFGGTHLFGLSTRLSADYWKRRAEPVAEAVPVATPVPMPVATPQPLSATAAPEPVSTVAAPVAEALTPTAAPELRRSLDCSAILAVGSTAPDTERAACGMKALAGDGAVEAERDSQGNVLLRFLSGSLQFGKNSAVLAPTDQALVAKVVAPLKAYPQVQVDVLGHSDDRGKAAYNQKLSAQRAASVGEEAVKAGLERGRLRQVQGYGPDKPIADNATDAGRAANRRVELRLSRQGGQ